MPTITSLFLPTWCHVGVYSTWDEMLGEIDSLFLEIMLGDPSVSSVEVSNDDEALLAKSS